MYLQHVSVKCEIRASCIGNDSHYHFRSILNKIFVLNWRRQRDNNVPLPKITESKNCENGRNNRGSDRETNIEKKRRKTFTWISFYQPKRLITPNINIETCLLSILLLFSQFFVAKKKRKEWLVKCWFLHKQHEIHFVYYAKSNFVGISIGFSQCIYQVCDSSDK